MTNKKTATQYNRMVKKDVRGLLDEFGLSFRKKQGRITYNLYGLMQYTADEDPNVEILRGVARYQVADRYRVRERNFGYTTPEEDTGEFTVGLLPLQRQEDEQYLAEVLSKLWLEKFGLPLGDTQHLEPGRARWVSAFEILSREGFLVDGRPVEHVQPAFRCVYDIPRGKAVILDHGKLQYVKEGEGRYVAKVGNRTLPGLIMGGNGVFLAETSSGCLGRMYSKRRAAMRMLYESSNNFEIA